MEAQGVLGAPVGPMTYADLLRLPDDGLRHEIISGVHYASPSPALRHQKVLGRLHLEIGKWLESHDLGEVYFAPVDAVFSMFDVVVPDLLFVSHRRKRILTEKNVQGAPDLVVEVLSPSSRRRDLDLKRRLFEAAGAHEYSIVDPKGGRILVHRRLGRRRFAPPRELTAAARNTLTTTLLPGLEIDLSRLFR